MLHGFIGIVRLFELDVSKPSRYVWVNAVHRHFNAFDRSIGRKYFYDMFSGHISRQPAHVDFGGSWSRATSPTLWRLGSKIGEDATDLTSDLEVLK